MPLIQVEQLSRYYADNCAVNNINFTLDKGDVLGFLGPNGAGKTTTMHMLSGLLAPSSGKITINGIDLLDQPLAAKRNLGFLPDTPPLYPDLTVEEFLDYCAHLHRVPKPDIVPAIKNAIKRCALDGVKKRLIGNLSRGYQQRVGIAQAILHNPEILILDEPTLGLDPIQNREIRILINELGQEHGIILSTHVLNEIQATCTRVQIIHQGQLVLHESISGLETLMGTSTVEVRTRLPIDLSKLNSLPSVSHIDSIAENHCKIHFDKHANPVEQIAEISINSGWGLQELMPQKRTLEEIFVQLTDAQQMGEPKPNKDRDLTQGND